MDDVAIDCAQLVRAGILINRVTALSIGDRYLVPNNGRMGVYVETGAEATEVTVEIPQTLDGQAVLPRVVPIPPNSLYGLGNWPTSIYNDAKSQVALSFSPVTGVSLFCACVS